MDIRAYYNKVRIAEQEITEPFVVMVSLETSDGGRPGVMTEVTKAQAARMVVDGRARPATNEEAEAYRGDMADARRTAEHLAAAGRVNMTVMTDNDLRALKSVLRTSKV